MGKIHVLDQAIANMIAAGEVVERPASVVKELVENAIDAKATHVTIEIKNGGTTYLRISDNGIGMTREDAKLCLVRHATSKVRSASDLEAIMTLGFRGEALASVAAVSNMEVLTKTAEDAVGTRVVVETGEITDCDDCGCPNGTTMVIRDLFVNTPARLKFLKKDATEAGYVTDAVHKLALSNPQVSFKYIRDGKELLFTAGDNSLQNCIFSVFGRDISKSMIPVEHMEEHIKVAGMTGKPDISRANRNFQNFFINGRYVKCPLLGYALDEAYKNQVMTGKFPSCVLNLQVDPAFVDVNVHPTKLEVKFSDERLVYRAVYWAVKNALYAKPNIPEVTIKGQEELQTESVQPALAPSAEPPRKQGGMPSAEPPHRHNDGRAAAFTPRVNPFLKKPGELREPAAAYQPVSTPPVYQAGEGKLPSQSRPAEQQAEPQTGEMRYELEQEAKRKAAEASYEQEAVLKDMEPDIRVVGQVFDTYIIVERGKEMLLLDQHAAHERLRYEELRRQFENRAVLSQGLLIPVVVDLSGSEMGLIQENLPFFEELGFELEPFGNTSVVIRSSPEDLNSQQMKELFLEFVNILRQGRRSSIADMQSSALYSISCKGALKANHKMDQAALETLVKAVFALPNINTCPHGRPITIAFTQLFLEKQFKRVL